MFGFERINAGYGWQKLGPRTVAYFGIRGTAVSPAGKGGAVRVEYTQVYVGSVWHRNKKGIKFGIACGQACPLKRNGNAELSLGVSVAGQAGITISVVLTDTLITSVLL